VELTRTYTDEESARFVNSVLDTVRLNAEAAAPLPPQALSSP
jgi:transcription termination factor NusB